MIRTTVTALRRATKSVGLVVGQQSTIPVLSYLLLRTEAGFASLVGTNLEQTVTAAIDPVEVERDVAVTVRAKPLLDVLRLLPPDDEISLEVEKLHAVVRCGALVLRLAHLPVEDFPSQFQDDKQWVEFDMPSGELLRLLAAVAFCVSTEETRYYLNGIYLHATKAGKLASVATDGHRLMVATSDLPSNAANMRGIIVPRAAVKMLRIILPTVSGDTAMRVMVRDTRLQIDLPGCSFFTKTIDGTFPEYDRVVPAANPRMARLVVKGAKGWDRALQQVRAVSDERAPPIRFKAADQLASLAVGRSGGDEAQIIVPAEVAAWEGEPYRDEFGFQAKYLRAIAGAFPGGFTMQVQNRDAPCRIEGPEGVAVLMPMRVWA